MQIQDIPKAYGRNPRIKALGKCIEDEKRRVIQLCGLQGSAAPLVFASLPRICPQVMAHPYLFILDDEEQAGYFYHDLTQILGDEQVLFFPSSFKRAVKYGQRDAGNEILRTEVLSRISSGALPLYVVTHPQALAELVVTREDLSRQTLCVNAGEQVDMDFVEEVLLGFGFRRVDYVYEPGQFAVRGSIIDVFSYSCEYPYRMDFFGDRVDSIRTFDVETQLSQERQQSVNIVPELSSSADAQGMSRQCIFSFLPKDCILVMHDLAFVCEVVEQTWTDGFSQQAIAVEEAAGQARQSETRDILAEPSVFRQGILDFRRIELLSGQAAPSASLVTFHTHPQPIFHKNFNLLFQYLGDYADRGYDIFILADSEKQTDRLESIFHDQNTGIMFTPVGRTIHSGFVDDDTRACYFTDHQIFDRFHKYNLRSERTRNGKVALTLKELQQFQIGDYVVHIDHGVGRFGGLVTIPNGDHMSEVIKIIYQHDDVVFVSIHSLHKVSKYKGREGEPPRISRLGTGSWERMKERTKNKIKDIARDLIRLYSRRSREKGFAYSPDSYMQQELEASFLYEDTPDQLKATNDVKADMERDRPMDRLVCGDVGFGKTEVAIRAAFKACTDGKQVAVLVPTTVLAYQHYRTFGERLKGMPVRIEYLSRARSAAKTKEILDDLKAGRVDIIVGTHKLLGKQVRFHDLGLLIIDEEQKFGVSTKEKLRQMKTNVDTLTLTATPIPRTLQFSLMGARDLSVIQTPPPNRYPIQTQLCAFSGEMIAEAINFEMSRNGQVFFVNNRISNLPELEDMIHRYVPDARVAVAHGQMPTERLEQVMLDFANYDYDVLLSTSIIESGLDIPNANTIIINAAQNFGLSDLHQMRGRVGRSNKKAFCYLISPPLSTLNLDARRRLQAIENFSELGSGIHLAMQDLDIRGAGNLLGAEQSGFIADLGYETYQKILKEAMQELREEEALQNSTKPVPTPSTQAGKTPSAPDSETALRTSQPNAPDSSPWQSESFVLDCVLESDLPMSFSEQYVPTTSERMLLYRELDGLEREEDVQSFRRRMEDRFGPIPEEAEELIRVVQLRRLGKHFGTERIVLKAHRMRLFFASNPSNPFYQSVAFGQLLDFATMNAHRCRLDEQNGRRSLLILEVDSVRQALDLLSQIQHTAPSP